MERRGDKSQGRKPHDNKDHRVGKSSRRKESEVLPPPLPPRPNVKAVVYTRESPPPAVAVAPAPPAPSHTHSGTSRNAAPEVISVDIDGPLAIPEV